MSIIYYGQRDLAGVRQALTDHATERPRLARSDELTAHFRNCRGELATYEEPRFWIDNGERYSDTEEQPIVDFWTVPEFKALAGWSNPANRAHLYLVHNTG